VPMCIAISPKHPVASVIGFLKGKSAIAVARLSGQERNFTGEHFWARLRSIDRRVRTGTGPSVHPRAGNGRMEQPDNSEPPVRRAPRDA